MLRTTTNDSLRTLLYKEAVYTFMFNNDDSVNYYLALGSKEFSNKNYIPGIALIKLLRGIQLNNKDLLPQAEQEILEAQKLYLSIGDSTNYANTLSDLGVVEGKRAQFQLATEYFVKAVEIFERQKDTASVLSLYLRMGVVQELTGNYDKALILYNKALSICPEYEKANKSTIFNNIGTVNCRRKRYREAIPYFKKALILLQDSSLRTKKIYPLTNIGECYHNLYQQDSARYYFNEALKLAENFNHGEERLHLLLNLCFLEDAKKPETGLKKVRQLFREADSLQMVTVKADLLSAEISLLKDLNRYEEAIKVMEALQQLKDSINSVSKASAIAGLQATYENQQSLQTIARLLAEQKIKEQNKREVLAIAIILAAGILVFTYYYIRSRKLNARLAKHEAELERMNRVKDKLFSIIGHDLRGSVGSIHSLIELLQKDKDATPEECSFMIDTIGHSANASLETLETLLSWGKTQIKGVSISPSVFTCANLVQQVVKQQNFALEKKSITVRSMIPEDLAIYADKNHFLFVVRNLLSNAIKYSYPSGTIEISADASRQATHVVFHIQDYGTGIPQEKLHTIFESSNISMRGTANEVGSSIALMLCKEFIAENGGKIWVESLEGNGSSFYFTLKKEG